MCRKGSFTPGGEVVLVKKVSGVRTIVKGEKIHVLLSREGVSDLFDKTRNCEHSNTGTKLDQSSHRIFQRKGKTRSHRLVGTL